MSIRSHFSAVTLAAALGAMAFVTGAAAQGKTVTIALEGAYEPWNLTNPDGTLGGFEPELAKVLCAHAKFDCKLIAQDWDGVITGLTAGKFDAVMDALSITPEREKIIAFSIPYAATPAIFAVTKSGDLAKLPGTGTTVVIPSLDSSDGKKEIDALRAMLKGKTIGIQAATVYADFIYKNFKDIADVREYKTTAERDLDLTAGRIDAGFDDETYFNSAFSKPDNADLTVAGPAFAGGIWGKGEGIGLRKEDTELKAKFDDAIKAALADGTVKQLSEKWFKLDVSPK